MIEQIETFEDSNLYQLRREINEWLEEWSKKIEVIERKFGVCAISHGDYPQERIPLYSYVIVYREK